MLLLLVLLSELLVVAGLALERGCGKSCAGDVNRDPVVILLILKPVVPVTLSSMVVLPKVC